MICSIGPFPWSLGPADLPGWGRGFPADEPPRAHPAAPRHRQLVLPPRGKGMQNGFVWSSLLARMARDPVGPPAPPPASAASVGWAVPMAGSVGWAVPFAPEHDHPAEPARRTA